MLALGALGNFAVKLFAATIIDPVEFHILITLVLERDDEKGAGLAFCRRFLRAADGQPFEVFLRLGLFFFHDHNLAEIDALHDFQVGQGFVELGHAVVGYLGLPDV